MTMRLMQIRSSLNEQHFTATFESYLYLIYRLRKAEESLIFIRACVGTQKYSYIELSMGRYSGGKKKAADLKGHIHKICKSTQLFMANKDLGYE
jgi:hypothetical protein